MLILGEDIATGRQVTLADLEQRQGTYVLGKTGMGKSTFLQSLVLQKVRDGEGFALIDPHGELTEGLLARIPSNRQRDVYVLDFADAEFAIALNPLQCEDPGDFRRVSLIARQVEEIFHKRWDDSWGPRVAQILRNSAHTLIENQGYTIADIPRLLLDEEFRRNMVSNVAYPPVREFWEQQFSRWRTIQQPERIESTLNKVDEFLTPTVRHVIGQGRSTVDFRRAMDQGQMLFIKISIGALGPSDVDLLGSIAIAMLFNAAISREDMRGELRQFSVIADEYGRFATPSSAALLTEARKYAVATTVCHQTRSQLDDPNRAATLNAANLVFFGLIGEDAKEAAEQFDSSPPPTEVVGQRAIKTINQDVVAHLVRDGHENEALRRVINSFLAPLAAAANDLPESQFWSVHPRGNAWHDLFLDEGAYWTTRATLKSGLRLLNDFLVQRMEGRLSMREIIEHISGIVVELRGYFCLAPGEQPLLAGPSGSYRASSSQVSHQAFVNPFLPEDSALYLKKMIAACLLSLNGHEKTVAFGKSRGFYWHAYLLARNLKEEIAEQLAIERATLEAESAVDAISSLVFLGEKLAAQPVQVDSGQWEDLHDRPRTYSDVQAEIANRLVTQEMFHATCRILKDGRPQEFRIRTASFEILDESHSFAHVSGIREQSHKAFYRRREDVEASLSERTRAPIQGSSTARAVRVEGQTGEKRA